jgi:ubiquinone/menaquinone biosynthesis C-methylase UbiE
MRSQQIDFLHQIRSAELERALEYFPRVDRETSPKVLEIGAGTGHQALLLSGLGYDVTAIDVPASAYRNNRVFSISEYDGLRIPAEDRKFDVVFTSNVLEHVLELDRLLNEMSRVTALGGVGIHLLPTPTWRFWTAATHYFWLLKELGNRVFSGVERSGTSPRTASDTPKRHVLSDLIPARHGERGSLFTEVYFFSTYWWKRRFQSAYRIERVVPIGIFYTGSVSAGLFLSIKVRRFLAVLLGSACKIYIVQPRARRDKGRKTHDS